MNTILRVSLAFIFALVLTVGVCTVPAPAAPIGGTAIQNSVQLEAVSGKITSTHDGSFTLDVGHKTPTVGQSFQARHRNTMTFFVDSNTTVDGKLVPGAMADVTFRVDNGNNLAVSVHVSP